MRGLWTLFLGDFMHAVLVYVRWQQWIWTFTIIFHLFWSNYCGLTCTCLSWIRGCHHIVFINLKSLESIRSLFEVDFVVRGIAIRWVFGFQRIFTLSYSANTCPACLYNLPWRLRLVCFRIRSNNSVWCRSCVWSLIQSDIWFRTNRFLMPYPTTLVA